MSGGGSVPQRGATRPCQQQPVLTCSICSPILDIYGMIRVLGSSSEDMKKLVGAIFSSTLIACSFVTQAQVPLPHNTSVAQPGPEVRRELSAFAGTWTAKWSGILDSTFIVQSVDNEKAQTIYAWGDAPQWNTTKGYVVQVAKVLPGEGASLEFQVGSTVFTAKMSDDLSSIKMTRAAPGWTSIEWFKRATR